VTDRLTIVDKLREISALLELSGGNKFKARAYARGARALEAAKMPLDKLVEEKQLESLPGIGTALAKQIEEIYLTGKSTLLESLEKGLPAGVLELSQAANLGLHVLRTLSDELGIKSVDDLERAAREGRLETVKGFGPAKSARILKAIEKYRTKPTLIRLYDGLRLADSLAADLSRVKGVKNVALIGPVGEGLEMSPSLDLQVTTSDPRAVLEHARFGSMERADEKECRLRLADGTRIHLHFGPKPRAKPKDDLITREDIRGFVHCHSTWSDGRHTIEDMARAAEALGAEFITITDHSKTAFYAGGLDEERIRQQWDEIDEVQEKVGIRILKGTEADILADGAIDWPDSILERFDVIIASIHNRYKQDEEKMTARVRRALEWPGFKIWGHPLGRMVPTRPPIPLRLEEILDTVAETNSAIEINGDPIRMDLPPDIAKQARERNVPFVLGVDAHSTGNLDFLRVAVALARRAGVRKDEVLNAKAASAFAKSVRPRP
jgi:histidinol phosphatase-like PHP family hydrolase